MTATMPVPVTAVFAGLLTLMLVAISVRVTLLRFHKKVDLHDGGDPQLRAAIRAQGNFIEYVPLALGLMAIAEWTGIASWVIYTLGVVLLASRVAHAWGLYGPAFQARAAGATGTWIVLAVAALLVIARAA